MNVSIVEGELHRRTAGLTAWVRLESNRLSEPEARLDRASGGALSRIVRSGDFVGRSLESALLHPPRWPGGGRLLLVGLGPSGQVSPRRVLEACAVATRRARALRAKTVAIGLPESLLDPELVRAAAAGVVLGHHQFTAYRTEASAPPLRAAWLVVKNGASGPLRDTVRVGATWGEAVCIARDLAATP